VARPADAVASAKKATELDDHFGEGFAILGVSILANDQKAWSEAIAQAQQGAFLDPDNPLVQQAVGKIFEANGQLEQAAGAFGNLGKGAFLERCLVAQSEEILLLGRNQFGAVDFKQRLTFPHHLSGLIDIQALDRFRGERQ